MHSDKDSIVHESETDPVHNTERLCNKTDAEISCGQTSKQEFGRRMKGGHFAKGYEDQSIAKNSSNGQKNVERGEIYKLSVYSTRPADRTSKL